MLEEKIREEIGGEFRSLTHPVRLVVFTQKEECRFCEDMRVLAEDVAAASTMISVEVHDFVADNALAASLGVDKIPAMAVIGPEDCGIRFFGLPGGYEFTSLVEAILTAGSDRPPVAPETAALLAKLAAPVAIQVFATPT